MKISEISEKLGNVTKSYLLEPLNIEAIHAKIKAACIEHDVKYVAEAVEVENLHIFRATLSVSLSYKNILKHFNINYDHRPAEFIKVLKCYGTDSIKFKLDAKKWVDTNDLSCLDTFYTYGQPVITNLSRDQFLKASCEIQKHFAEKGGFTDILTGLNYNAYQKAEKAETSKRNFALELINLYSE